MPVVPVPPRDERRARVPQRRVGASTTGQRDARVRQVEPDARRAVYRPPRPGRVHGAQAQARPARISTVARSGT